MKKPSRRIPASLRANPVALKAMIFQESRLTAIAHARAGRRDAARWWGRIARTDWNQLTELLLA